MTRSCLAGVATVLSLALLGVGGTAWAASKGKKISYEQAWEQCKKEVALLGSEATTSAGRYTRGAACMKQHGYRLKKSSMAE